MFNMKKQIVTTGLIAAIGLFAVVGVTLATLATSTTSVQADPPPRHHHCHEPLPNGNPYPGQKPTGCPPGLEN
jgi:hypothetical protein